MSSTYSSADIFPTSAWPSFIQVPDDGDPFIAQSANIFEKALNDRNSLVLGALIKETSNTSSVKASSYDGSTINVYPFKCQLSLFGVYYVTPNDMPTVIDSSNLQPAGSFVMDTWYYVYAKVSLFLGNPVFSIIISTTGPLPYLLYKDNGGTQDLSSKFLFSFRTDASALIIPFQKGNEVVNYVNPRRIVTNGTAAAPIDLTPFIPPHSTLVYLKLDYTALDPAITSSIDFAQIVNSISFFPVSGVRNLNQFISLTALNLAFTPIQELDYFITTFGGTPGTVNMDLLSYHE